MNRQHLIAALCGLLATAAILSAQNTPFIVLTNGQRMRVRSIQADGTAIRFVDENGHNLRWRAEQFRAAYVPEPEQVAALEKFLEAKEYDRIIQFAGQVATQFGILGWGDKIAYIEGSAYLAKNEPVKAAEAFARGAAFAGGSYREQLARGRVLALLAQGKVDEVRDSLDAMIRSPRPADAAMAFNARGQILAKEDKPREAVLEYLKTLLLFDAGVAEVAPYRDEARRQVVALMRQIGDPKWRMFVDTE